MSTSPKQHLNLNDGFGALVVTSTNINVELTDDGNVIVHKGTVKQPDISAKADFKKALKTGDVIPDGPNKGWIFCEGEDVEPFLVAPRDSGVMKWEDAMRYAKRENMALPTREQLQTMYTARSTGALNNTFSGSHTAGWYWSSTYRNAFFSAWCQRFSDGHKNHDFGLVQSTVRCVRPYTPA